MWLCSWVCPSQLNHVLLRRSAGPVLLLFGRSIAAIRQPQNAAFDRGTLVPQGAAGSPGVSVPGAAQGGSERGSAVGQLPPSLHLSAAAARLPGSPSLRLPSFRPASIAPAAPASDPGSLQGHFANPATAPALYPAQQITPSVYVFKGFGKIYWWCCPPSVCYAVTRELSALKLLSPTQVKLH